MRNLALVVKKMERQLKNINLRIKRNAPKLLNKFIQENLGMKNKIKNSVSLDFKEI